MDFGWIFHVDRIMLTTCLLILCYWKWFENANLDDFTLRPQIFLVIVVLFMFYKLVKLKCFYLHSSCSSHANRGSVHRQKYKLIAVLCVFVCLCMYALGRGGGPAAWWKQPIRGGVQGLKYFPQGWKPPCLCFYTHKVSFPTLSHDKFSLQCCSTKCKVKYCTNYKVNQMGFHCFSVVRKKIVSWMQNLAILKNSENR